MNDISLAELLNFQDPAALATLDARAGVVPGATGVVPGQEQPLAGLGAQALKGLGAMQGGQPPAPGMAPSAGVAPRGQQIKTETPDNAGLIDPRIRMGLAQLLFGGGK